MDNALATHFPRFGPIAFWGQKRQITGAGISFSIHVVGVCLIMFLSSNISSFNPPLVIDFSIEESYGDTKTQKAAEQVVQDKNPPIPAIKKVAVVREPLPEKPKIAVTKNFVPLVTETKVVEEEKELEMVDAIEAPKLLDETQVVAKKIKEDIKPAKETVPAQVIASEKNSISTDSPPVDRIVTKSPFLKKERYLKEHFNYIKESVQGKISYPRIARKMGWQGRVLISFVICKDGSVKDIQIVESSGFNALDKNAVEVIQKGAPFPRPPVSAELIIPVIYKLS